MASPRGSRHFDVVVQLERRSLTAASPGFAGRLAAFASDDFRKLRPGQKLVLDEYAAEHLQTADLAIEMPTGDGKTLLALLIADWALDQGWSVAYLTGTRQLAEHVEAEAARLGLESVRFAARDYGGAKFDDYHQANGWRYELLGVLQQQAGREAR